MSDAAEASERALRALREESSGSSRTPLLSAKIERSLSPPLRPSSPDQTCAICLGEITDKSVTDSCFHRFCFSCLSEWSKVKPECPLCKARFTAIYHGIKSMNDFQVYRLDQSRSSLQQSMDSLDAAAAAAALDPHIFINVAVQRAFTGRFGYRTTMGLNRTTRGPSGHLFWGPPGTHDAIGAVPVSLPHPSSGPHRSVLPPLVLPGQSSASSSSSRRSARHQGMEFRKNVYRQNLWARPNPEQDRIRESSPEFYRANLAQTHRLVPWLARELAALSDMSSGFRFELACRDILQWIRLYPINSVDFKRNVLPYLGSKTDHFVHEFYQFAISPYDMQGYDSQTRYTPSTAEQEVARNASDDDMLMFDEVDHDIPLLPDNLGLHGAALRPCISPLGRPTRNISGRPRGLSSNNPHFDLRSYLFPHPIVSNERPAQPTVAPEVIVLSSGEENGANDSGDSDSEVQIIGSLPPLHLRPPEQVIDLDDSNDSDVIEIKPPTPPLIEIDDDNDDYSPQSPSAPSTSNGVAGPSGAQRAEGLRSGSRFFRPSYREYSSSSEEDVRDSWPKKKSSKKRSGASKRTTRSSKRIPEPKSSEFVESDSASEDLNQMKEDVKEGKETSRKRRKTADFNTWRSRKEDSDDSGVSKRQPSLPSKILASKKSKKAKTDDCEKCSKKRMSRDVLESSPERPRKSSKRRRRKSSCSSEDSSPPKRRRKSDRSKHESSTSSSTSSASQSSDQSQSSSSGFNDSGEGSSLARNPKAMSKKAMILRKRAAETSSDGPPSYRYGEMVELPYYTTLHGNFPSQLHDGLPKSEPHETAEDSDSSSSTTLSMGTEPAPRHFELKDLHPSYSPLCGPRSPSGSSFASSGRAVANSSPQRRSASPKPKSDSIPSGPPSLSSTSSDSSGSNSPTRSNDSWPDLNSQAETSERPSSPPNLRRFDDSPIITLEHSPLTSPPGDSSSWSSSQSPSASPPRLKSIVTRVNSPPASPTNSDNSSSDEEDEPQ